MKHLKQTLIPVEPWHCELCGPMALESLGKHTLLEHHLERLARYTVRRGSSSYSARGIRSQSWGQGWEFCRYPTGSSPLSLSSPPPLVSFLLFLALEFTPSIRKTLPKKWTRKHCCLVMKPKLRRVQTHNVELTRVSNVKAGSLFFACENAGDYGHLEGQLRRLLQN